jgi:hypothetical protein
MYFALFGQMKKQLRQMDVWFDKAEAHAKARSFDPNTFVSFRLAPDQFALARQVDSTCDTAKLAASRLTGKEAPKNDDDEKTLAELRARVKSVISYLDGFSEADFAGAATRTITQPRWEGRTMTGQDYFLEHALPNFYFHLGHTYALLRAAGVDVGKRDYLGALTQTKP